MMGPDSSNHYPRWSPPRGRVLRRALRPDPTQEYLLYVPAGATDNARVFVSVHGISRNFIEQANAFTALCDRYDVVMIAPVFTGEMHGDYQRLGRRGRGVRCDLLLNELLAETASLTGADVSQVHLFGFSAGAQFTHRYLMAHPHRVASAVLASAGWYTFPDNRERYPYGIRPHRKLEGVTFDPEQFLHVPVEVIVGALDTTTRNLRQTDRTNAQQGLTRVDRARNWVESMRNCAAACGIDPQVTLTEVPWIDHSFAALCSHGRLVERVGQSLFGEIPQQQPLRIQSHGPAPVVRGPRSVANGSRAL